MTDNATLGSTSTLITGVTPSRFHIPTWVVTDYVLLSLFTPQWVYMFPEEGSVKRKRKWGSHLVSEGCWTDKRWWVRLHYYLSDENLLRIQQGRMKCMEWGGCTRRYRRGTEDRTGQTEEAVCYWGHLQLRYFIWYHLLTVATNKEKHGFKRCCYVYGRYIMVVTPSLIVYVPPQPTTITTNTITKISSVAKRP